MLSLLIIWFTVTLGLIYLATRAVIFDKIRVRLVSRYEWIAGLLSCDRCTGFWIGILTSVVAIAHLQPDWYVYLYAPLIGGFATVGLVDLLERSLHE